MANNISPFIDEQFPSFYKEDGQFLIDFVKEYYKWMEQSGNAIYHSRRIPEYFDIDTTSDDFIIHFKEKYLPNFALLTETDKRTLVKHCIDIYRSKGSIRAIQLLFKLVYNDSVDVYWPGDDIIRASAGTYRQPTYLEVTTSDRTALFVGKEIVGERSGARAIVESVSRRDIRRAVIDIIQLSNIRGDFEYGELITDDGTISNAPRVIGSLTTLAVTSGGRSYNIGDILNINSDEVGFGGQAKVTAVITQSGQALYELTDGGTGYSANADIYVSERVLGFENLRTWPAQKEINTITQNGDGEYTWGMYEQPGQFLTLETITQPLVNVYVGSASAVYPIGSYVYGVNSSTIIAVGAVVNTTQESTSYTTGTLIISDRTAAHITLDTVVNAEPETGSFHVGDTVYQRALNDSSSNTAVGYVYGANSTTIAIDVSYGEFLTNTTIQCVHSTTANVASITTFNQRFTNTDISDYKSVNSVNFLTATATPSYDVTSVLSTSPTSRTASATYIGGNTTHVGLYNISTTASFLASNVAFVKGSISNTYANSISISSGTPGGFEIASLTDTETLYLGKDQLSSNNNSGVPYTSLAINAATFGFPKDTAANSSSPLIDTLELESTVIGTIGSIGSIDPGSYNSIEPVVLIYEKKTAGYGRRNYTIEYYDKNEFPFTVGESITQLYTSPYTTVTFSTLTGNTQFDTTGVGESVSQVRSDGVEVHGIVTGQSVGGATKTITIGSVYATQGIITPGGTSSANGNLLPNETFNTSNNIVGLISSAVANTISSVVTGSDVTTTEGIVLTDDGSALTVERTRFADSTSAYGIQGAISGAVASISSISPITSSAAMGENATTVSDAGSSSGVVTEVDVISSGYGYAPGEVLTMTSTGNPYAVTATAGVTSQGTMAGDWQSTDGFLSSDKKIQDSDYYQEYSYEIQSSLSRSTYERKVKDTIHVAGTKMFGAVVSRQEVPSVIDALDVDMLYALQVLSTSGFNVGDNVSRISPSPVVHGTVVSIANQSNVTFNALSDVSTGQQITFNSNTDVSNGSAVSFNAFSSINEGTSIRFNANTDIVANANFTINANTSISNAISFTFNANTDVVPGAQAAFTNSAVITGTTITANSAKVIRGGFVTFDAGSDVDSAASSTVSDLNANVVSSYRSFSSNNSITPAYSTTFHTVTSATTRITQSGGSYETPLTPLLDYIDVSSANTYFSAGDKVKYNVNPDYSANANDAVVGIIDGRVYTVHSANSTALSLIGPDGTNKLQWSMSYNAANASIRHTLTLVSGLAISGANSTIAITNANTYFDVGDTVTYTTDGNGNPLVNLLANTSVANNGTYYIQHANTTVIALANTAGGSRIPLVKTPTNQTHYAIGYARGCGLIVSAGLSGAVTAGDVVHHTASAGQSIRNLAGDQFYTVQFANATHTALAKMSSPSVRIPLAPPSSTGTSIFYYTTAGSTGAIAIATANTFSTNDAVTYVCPASNTLLTYGAATNLSNNQTYYVQLANDTHVALSLTPGGPRLPLNAGTVGEVHAVVGSSLIVANNTFAIGDQVQYFVSPGNTAITGLTTNSTYYVHSSNSTTFALTNDLDNIVLNVAANTNFNPGDIAFQNNAIGNTATATVVSVGLNTVVVNNATLKGTFTTTSNVYSSNVSPGNQAIVTIDYNGAEISLTKGISQIGHSFIPLGDKSTIQIDGTSFDVGSEVKYFTSGSVIPGLANNTSYYILSSNSSSVSLSNVASGGVRIALTGFTGVPTGTPTYHNLLRVGVSDTITTLLANTFSVNESVVYELANNSLRPLDTLERNKTYYVQLANDTHFAISASAGGVRIPLRKGNTESGHSFRSLNGSSSIITSGYGANLEVDQPLVYTVSSGNTAITGLSNNATYYVQFANATSFAIAASIGGNRIAINQGVTESGHTFLAGDAKSTLTTTLASLFEQGEAVKYITSPGNTPLAGFTNNTTYYVEHANDTHISFSTTLTGDRIQLTKGLTENGHFFTPLGTKATIEATNDFTAGDEVMYTLGSGNTSLIGFTNSVADTVVSYFIESANVTHFALSTSSGGPRIRLYKGANEAGHTFSTIGTKGIIADASASAFANNDEVIYSTSPGNTTLTGLSNNSVYYIQFANATHVALSSSVDGYRIPIKKSLTESGHAITKTGDKNTIDVTNATMFAVGEPVSYHVSAGNTAIGGLISGTTYYIQYANSTHLALSATEGGPRIVLTAGSSETGHTIKDATINTITISVTSTANQITQPIKAGQLLWDTTTVTSESILAVEIIS